MVHTVLYTPHLLDCEGRIHVDLSGGPDEHEQKQYRRHVIPAHEHTEVEQTDVLSTLGKNEWSMVESGSIKM